MKPVVIRGREISEKNPPYIIAEVSANHNGSLERARETIKVAKDAGASAVKIQTYTPDTMTIDVAKDDFLITEGLWKGYSLYELYGEAYTPFEWHKELFTYARALDVTLFSSPFDETAVDLLENLDTPAYKVASFELVDLPLISYMASTGKPMLMSTGMASLEEIGEAVETARINGCEDIALFHCISSYPTPMSEANMRTILKLQREFDLQVGLSDHTLGTTAAVAATAIGATLIEKHFTLSRQDKGPDSTFSIEPDELQGLVSATRDAHSALGVELEARAQAEEGNKAFRRSLYFVEDLERGQVIEVQHVRRIRPGFGLPPKYFSEIIGRKVSRDIRRGDRVSWDVLQEE